MFYIRTLHLRPGQCVCLILQIVSMAVFSDGLESSNISEVINSTQIDNVNPRVDNEDDLRISQENKSSLPLVGEVETQPPVRPTEEPTQPTTQPTTTTSPSTSVAPDRYSQRSANILASKFMGSLFVAYILLCVVLAVKHGPMFLY